MCLSWIAAASRHRVVKLSRNSFRNVLTEIAKIAISWHFASSRHRGFLPAFVSSSYRERGRRIRLPAAGAHPSRLAALTTAPRHILGTPLAHGVASAAFCGFSSDSALRTTTAAQTRLPCRRIRRPHSDTTNPSRHRDCSSSHRGAPSWLTVVSSRHRGFLRAFGGPSCHRVFVFCLQICVLRG